MRHHAIRCGLQVCGRRLLAVAIIAACTATAGRAHAACGGPAPQVLIVLDRSGSMKESAGTASKWTEARTAINQLTNAFAGQLDLGLMLFPKWPQVSNCTTGQVNIGVGSNTGAAINSLLSSSYPSGDTPSTNSLKAAGTYLSGVQQVGKAQYVIFITDGKETCSPNWPNTATSQLLAAGIKTFVVGFGSGVHVQSLADAARDGGTGQYYQANNTSSLQQALSSIAAQISCCGDGKLDAGELCDTGITPGAPGSCPTSCNDNNNCTADAPTGSGCNRRCTFTPVTAMVSGDGCCPVGANSATDSDCPAACGNGVLDPGERCDTGIAFGAGACPTTCNDNNACTADSMVGNGCQAYCTHTNTCPVNNCGNGRIDAGERCDTGIPFGSPGGCPTIPAQCDDNNPNTQDVIVGGGCQAVCSHVNAAPTSACGDGKVDPGEWCDTAIPAGKPGSCPLTCHDGNSCTQDLMVGSGCLTQCQNPPITQAVSGDGCCAPGATYATDTDCPNSQTCGNGTLDPGETCDPAIANGQAGSCPVSCNDGDKCTVDRVGGSGCQVKCVSLPVAPSTVPDGCCPAGMTQKQDPDCLPPCGPDRHENCIDPCQSIKCNDGTYCSNGQCIPWPQGGSEPQTQPQANPGAPGGSYDVGGGCDCNASGAGGGNGTMLLLGLILLVWNRRRAGRR